MASNTSQSLDVCEGCSALDLSVAAFLAATGDAWTRASTKTPQELQRLVEISLYNPRRLHRTSVRGLIERPQCGLCRHALSLLWRAEQQGEIYLPYSTTRRTPRVKVSFSDWDVSLGIAGKGYGPFSIFTIEAYLGDHLDINKMGACFTLVPASPIPNSMEPSPLVGRVIAKTFDSRMAARWVDACELHHGDTCRGPSEDEWFVFEFWAIDVMELQLRVLPHAVRFIALSYVWGGFAADVTTSTNLDSRSQPGGLQEVIAASGKLIQDSVTLVRDMGERYLWIDQLCIVQDDKEVLNKTLAAMADIYRFAEATVVSTGPDADTGLQGIQPNSRTLAQEVINVGPQSSPVSLVSRTEGEILEGSAYMKRGWTYQEYFFSRRRIIFRDGMVSFYCLQTNWQEDFHPAHLPLHQGLDNGVEFWYAPERFGIERFSTSISKPISSSSTIDDAIQRLISEYTSRQLTFDEDILRAFAGMSVYLNNHLKVIFYYGLPKTSFLSGLMWKLAKPSKRRPGFPTWSWTSRYGEVECQGDNSADVIRSSSVYSQFEKRTHKGAFPCVWSDFYISEPLEPNLIPVEGNARYIDLPRLIRLGMTQPLNHFFQNECISPNIADRPHANTKSILCMTTMTLKRNIGPNVSMHLESISGMVLSVFDSSGGEIGCVHVDDDEHSDFEGIAELILISFTEGIRLWTLDGQNPRGSSRLEEESGPGKGFFNILWVVDGDASRQTKIRVGSGVILEEFVLGLLEEEIVFETVFVE